ncbi:MAG TPA: hypothetical protein VMZ53_04070 [Kofleriaceae bacterium]|nr:hypothetical protein [Kofleriaceae bacterium]
MNRLRGAHHIITLVVVGVLAEPTSEAQPQPEGEPVETQAASPAVLVEPPPPVTEEVDGQALAIHGFVSEGAFISTANDYLGVSSRGSVELFEAGLNVSKDIADRLHAGIQLYARDVGTFRDLPPRLDWAYLDYHWKAWLGLRAGVIKMPFGLYNEYADVDAARTAILMPQSVYPLRDRSALLAQTGFSIYGERSLGACAGSLEYQAWLGTLNIPENALELTGARLDDIDTKYVTGAQLFWHTPLDGLRIGGTFLRTSIDFKLTLDPSTVSALIMAGLVPADFTGKLVISQRPDQLWIASAEYIHDDWSFAAEYSRAYKRQTSTLRTLLPTFEDEAERFYALVTRRLSPAVELGAYYSVLYADVDDRHGRDMMKYAKPFAAWQRDASATLRFDVNDRWLWKLEGHVIDGTADLFASKNPDPERWWGLFLVKTTVTF